MNPFNTRPLTEEELEQDCLCYMSFDGKPVKSSRLFAGNEHEQQVKRLGDYFQKGPNYYTEVMYKPDLVNRIDKTQELATVITGKYPSVFAGRDFCGGRQPRAGFRLGLLC